MGKTCSRPGCDRGCYGEFCIMHKPRKPIKITNPSPLKRYKRPRQMSDKEKEYQTWKEEIARPYLIARDGNSCCCCKRPAFSQEKLDIEHTLGKGSHPKLKRDLSNLTLMCRWPCHHNKTIGKPCLH